MTMALEEIRDVRYGGVWKTKAPVPPPKRTEPYWPAVQWLETSLEDRGHVVYDGHVAHCPEKVCAPRTQCHTQWCGRVVLPTQPAPHRSRHRAKWATSLGRALARWVVRSGVPSWIATGKPRDTGCCWILESGWLLLLPARCAGVLCACCAPTPWACVTLVFTLALPGQSGRGGGWGTQRGNAAGVV
jgi:hypothetical protein